MSMVVIYVETMPAQLGVKKCAIVSGIEDGILDLHVLESGRNVAHDGPKFEPVRWVGSVPYDLLGKPGSWHHVQDEL